MEIQRQRVEQPVSVNQPAGKTVLPLIVMVLPCSDQSWPAAPVDLDSFPW